MDEAMTPVSEHEEEPELFQSTDAVAYLEQEKQLERARRGDFSTAAE